MNSSRVVGVNKTLFNAMETQATYVEL